MLNVQPSSNHSVRGQSPSTETAQSNVLQLDLALVDLCHHCPVAGASVIQFCAPEKEEGVLAGFSDAQGHINQDVMSPHLRILAQGYTPKDLSVKSTGKQDTVEMQALAEGAYSGHLPHKKRAIWAPDQRNGAFFEFTADGLMRKAQSLASLMKTPFQCYSMQHGSHWNGLSTPPAGSSEWYQLQTAELDFPITWKASTERQGLSLFKFPETGLMIARSAANPNLEVRHTIIA